MNNGYLEVISLVERLEKPTVAAINGVATGAGTQLALACDVRLMATGARFVYREGTTFLFEHEPNIDLDTSVTKPRAAYALAYYKDNSVLADVMSWDDVMRMLISKGLVLYFINILTYISP